MKDILNVKYELHKNKPYQVSAKVKPVEDDKQMEKYMHQYQTHHLHHKHELANEYQDDKAFKTYTGGIKNTHAMSHLARQHYYEHARKNLEHQANLHNLRLASNPNFYKHEEKSDSRVFERIKNDFISLLNNLKSNNISKDVVNQASDIQSLLLNEGYNLTSSDLIQVLQNYSLCREILNNDIIRESQDIKDSGNFQSLKNFLTQIREIAEQLIPTSEQELRKRIFNQQGLKLNYQNKLQSKDTVMKNFAKTMKNLDEKLQFDERYQKIQKKRAEAKEAEEAEEGEEKAEEPGVPELLAEIGTYKDYTFTVMKNFIGSDLNRRHEFTLMINKAWRNFVATEGNEKKAFNFIKKISEEDGKNYFVDIPKRRR